jgi:hypothetical protein
LEDVSFVDIGFLGGYSTNKSRMREEDVSWSCDHGLKQNDVLLPSEWAADTDIALKFFNDNELSFPSRARHHFSCILLWRVHGVWVSKQMDAAVAGALHLYK